VIDLKDNNPEYHYEQIAKKYPGATKLIPQVYAVDSYEKVRRSGYSEIVFSVYRIKRWEYELSLVRIVSHKPKWVAVPYRPWNIFLPSIGSVLGVKVYAFTVNNSISEVLCRLLGFSGIYTDIL
jgi:hypothetical protein